MELLSMDLQPLYTIGYSRFQLSQFLKTVKSFDIAAILDVRSIPFSSRFRAFNRDSLKASCEKAGITYAWLGETLGGLKGAGYIPIVSVEDLSEKLKETAFISGCGILRKHLEKAPACLLCAENDPINCHRGILISHLFRQLYPGAEIIHIWKGKNSTADIVETQNAFDERVLDKFLKKDPSGAVSGNLLDHAYAAINARFAKKQR